MNERIQHELELIAHPELWCAEDWLELRAGRSRWYTCCTPQENKEENTSRGQYKEHVLSRYHRSTQNREQYISNNNIKSTTYSTGDNNKYHNHLPQPPAHLWGLKPPQHTHVGNRFFEFEYINMLQDYFYSLLSCRNVTLWSPNTTVSERDTPIP